MKRIKDRCHVKESSFTNKLVTMVTRGKGYTAIWLQAMVTMGGDLQPGCLADRLLTGLGQPQINP
jgi:hypothetical protein